MDDEQIVRRIGELAEEEHAEVRPEGVVEGYRQ